MFLELTKTIGITNFVGTIGNTIYKEWGMVYLQRVTMFLIIHGTMQI
jgi:hypothetical protein